MTSTTAPAASQPSPATTVPGALTMLRPVVRLLGAVRARRGLFLRSTASMTGHLLAAAAAATLSTFVATVVIDDGADVAVLPRLFVGLAAAVLTTGVLLWVESWLSHVLAYRVLADLRMQLHDAIERLAPGGLGRRRGGELAGAAMQDVEQLEWFYAHTVGAALNAVAVPALLGTVLVVLVGPVGLLVPAGVATVLATPWALASLQARQGAAVRDELGALEATVLEGRQGLRELLTLGLVDDHRAQVLDLTRRVQDRRRAFALRAGVESAVADAVIAVTTVGFLVLLTDRVAAGAVQPEVLPAATVLAVVSFTPSAGAFAMFQRLGEMSAAARRVLDVLDAPAPVADPTGPVASSPTDRGGQVRFDDVHFAYGTDAAVLRGLDLEVPAGQTVALVGASGAGKTTVAHLLARLWDPTSGRILLDGTDLSALRQTDVRDRITVVQQRQHLFRGTVRTNLAMAAPDADDERLWDALMQAQLADAVHALPDGLDAPVGEDAATLSGGQRQRLAIAQALLRDPDVLVLDEPAAHLDATSELELGRALAALRRGRTTVVIAHRLATIQRADRVLLLADGRIRADGPHDQLLAEEPAYRSLLAAAAPPVGEPPASRAKERR